MGGAHVEGLEVVPVGLDLRAFGDLEAHADEHVLETLPRLGDDVRPAAPRLAEELRQVEALVLDLGGASVAGELASLGRDGVRDGSGRLVQLTTSLPALVQAGERPELGLQPAQRAPATEHLAVDRHQGIERRGGADVGERGLASSTDVFDQGGHDIGRAFQFASRFPRSTAETVTQIAIKGGLAPPRSTAP